MTVQQKIKGGTHQNRAHDSGIRHVTGQATYVDDIPVPHNCLHLAMGLSTEAHADIVRMDLDAVRTAPNVVAVFTAEDIPGINDASPVMGDDPVLAEGTVQYKGQPVFLVAATDVLSARRAARMGTIEYAPKPAILTVDDALKAKSYVLEPRHVERGDVDGGLSACHHKLSGTIHIGGQDHFYLEGQVALAVPGEDDEIKVHCSSQHPTEVQHNTAKVLGVPDAMITVEVRRMGGGFGGKETQPAIFAAMAALVAHKTGRAAKLRLDRDDDMIITGKRHPMRLDYTVGFDARGHIQALDMKHALACGYSADLSGAIADRALFHTDNTYFLPAVRMASYRCKLNTVSHTAFRGFGGPQGMVGIERIMTQIANHLGEDPLLIRKRNLYGPAPRNVTPYMMEVEDNVAPQIIEKLQDDADYDARRKAITAHNATHPYLRRGIALTPVKFGISFTTTFLNQAGALIHIYTDGSVYLNHGGTEMGQGLFIKVAQVVAETFCVDVDRIRISATTTDKVPNTSATAASSGSDLNGKAAEAAALTIKQRLTEFAAEIYQTAPENIIWEPNQIRIGTETMGWDTLIKKAYLARISLSSTGYYRTPKINYDAAAFSGRPFFYFAYGAAVTEVTVDTLTGEYRIDRVDLLHDVGKSLNPALDLGQIEGAYVQGVGWLTTEELVWTPDGRLATHAPSTYKVPACSDRARDMRITLFENKNHEDTIYRSKAVGEPPFMLAISAYEALHHAIEGLAPPGTPVHMDAPATPERVLKAMTDLQAGQPKPSEFTG